MRTYVWTYASILTEISSPEPQTVCDASEIMTIIYEDEPQTEYEYEYITLTTQVTVWIGYARPSPRWKTDLH